MKITLALPLFFHLFLWSSHALRVNINFREAASRLNVINSVANILQQLIESRKYKDVVRLLENPVLSLAGPYKNACSKLHRHNFIDIVNNRDLTQEELKTLLPPDCIHSAIKTNSIDPITLHRMPSNALESNLFLRFESNSDLFRESILVDFERGSQKINWKMVFSTTSAYKELFLLQQIFPVDHVIESQRNAFMARLTPDIIKEASDSDLGWMIRICKPEIVLLPLILDRGSVKLMEVQLFRILTTAVIRNRVLLRLGRLKDLQADRPERKDLALRIQCYYDFFNEIERNLGCVKHFHEEISILPTNYLSFINVLSAIGHALEMAKSGRSFGRPHPRFFNSMVNRCIDFLPVGDWMVNLIYMFPLNNISDTKNFSRFLEVFHSKKPTMAALSELATGLKTYALPDHVEYFFNSLPPEQLELYATVNQNVPEKSVLFSLDFKTRKRLFLRSMRASALSFSYLHSYVCIPQVDDQIISGADRNSQLELFKKMISLSVLHNSIVRPHNLQLLVLGDKKNRAQTGMVYIQAFFRLFLSIQEFYFIINDRSDPYGRPVIVISPLLSPLIATLLGKCLVSALAFCYRVPFLLDFDNFSDILSPNEPNPSPRTTEHLRAFSENTRQLQIAADLTHASNSNNGIAAFANIMIPLLKGVTEPSSVMLQEHHLDLAISLYKQCSNGAKKAFKMDPMFERFTAEEIYSMVFFQ